MTKQPTRAANERHRKGGSWCSWAGWLIQNTSHSSFSDSYVLRNLRPDNEYVWFSSHSSFLPLRSASEQLHFLHWFPSLCNSSFLSWSSNFWMLTRCFIRNFPFKWKTGMSYLYLSYHAEFSGRVISTSCKINCGRKEICQFLLDTEKQYLLVLWAVFSLEMQGYFLEACGFILCIVDKGLVLWVQNICNHNPWQPLHKEPSS